MFIKTIKASLISIAVLLAGCSTTFIEDLVPETEINYQEMYVRGVFTWWEADDNYRLVQVSSGVYSANAKLIADGQPYDFKFANENWTPGMSCGGSNGAINVELDLGSKVSADCQNPQGNFKFTPDETGTYGFVIDFSNPSDPQVYVKRVE